MQRSIFSRTTIMRYVSHFYSTKRLSFLGVLRLKCLVLCITIITIYYCITIMDLCDTIITLSILFHTINSYIYTFYDYKLFCIYTLTTISVSICWGAYFYVSYIRLKLHIFKYLYINYKFLPLICYYALITYHWSLSIISGLHIWCVYTAI